MADLTGAITNQAVYILIVMLTGFLLTKFSVLSEGGLKEISALLINIVNPAVIFLSFREIQSREELKSLFLSGMLAAGVLAIGFLISLPLIRAGDGGDSAAERFCAIYPEWSFMGIPVIYAAVGSEGVFYLTGFIIVSNILIWSHGRIMLSPAKSFGNIAKILFSPVMLSVYLSIAFFMFNISVPEAVIGAMTSVSAISIPLTLIIAGAAFARADILKNLFSSGIYRVSLVKLILCPLAVMLILKLFPFDEALKRTAVMAAAMPTAAAGTLICIRQEQNPPYASQLFAATTAFSLFTLPLAAKVFGMIS